MPTSYHQAISYVVSQVVAAAPRSVLDIGVGFGKYGVLLREALEVAFGRYSKSAWQTRLDGVEAFVGYRNPIHEFVYDKIWYQDIRTALEELPDYDVILLVDVLEHFSKAEGVALLRALLSLARKFVLVSTPLYPDRQSSYLGNDYEVHKSRWHVLDFAEFDIDYHLVPTPDGGAQVVKLFPTSTLRRLQHVDGMWESRRQARDARLRIGYVLPHHRVTGGLRMLLDQARQLRARGHTIRAIIRKEHMALPNSHSAIPQWSDVVVDEQRILEPGYDLADAIDGCDLVVAGWLDQLSQLRACSVPAIYWEQGHEWLFGEIDPRVSTRVRQALWSAYTQPVPIATTSPFLSWLLWRRYGRHVATIPCGVDTRFSRLALISLQAPYCW